MNSSTTRKHSICDLTLMRLWDHQEAELIIFKFIVRENSTHSAAVLKMTEQNTHTHKVKAAEWQKKEQKAINRLAFCNTL